ncbi:MAG: portal protein [Methylobacter sp.]|jgi:hypothetical protein
MSEEQFKQINKRWSALKQERASWLTHWADISNNILPYNGRYLVSDRNKGGKRNNNIYDNTGTRALRVLTAGMMSGMTSPSRPWFLLSVADTDLMKYQPVKLWLNAVSEQISGVLAKSNCYRVLHGMYGELGAFGTSPALIAEDYKNIIHLHPFTAGQYAIATDHKGNVDTLYREFDTTVGNMVGEFGLENCSNPVQIAYKRGKLDDWHTIIHAIEPRADRDTTKKDSINMPFSSVYLERSGGQNKLLRESGYKSFPCVVPRWETVGGDIYGVSPGMDALGDIKQLQMNQYRKSQVIDYQANPPLQLPVAFKNREAQLFPGGFSYYDETTAAQGIRTAFEVKLDLNSVLVDIQDVRTRINSAFYSDLFLMISQQAADGRMTATEVAARNQEKLLMLGPAYDRLSNELLDPLVETVFERLLMANMLPEPPEELQGHGLNIEYVSMLAQAQQAVAINSIDRFVSSLGAVAQINPNVLDKFDADQWADIASEKIGVPPELIRASNKVVMIRQERAAAQQQAEKQQQMQEASQVLKNVGQTSTQPGTAAGDVLAALKGKQQNG